MHDNLFETTVSRLRRRIAGGDFPTDAIREIG